MKRIVGAVALITVATSISQAAIFDVAPEAHQVKALTRPVDFVVNAAPRSMTTVAFEFDSWDEEFDTSNDMPTIDVATALGMPAGSEVTVTGLGWDLNMSVQNFSWFSESVIKIGDSLASPSLFLQPGLGDDFGSPPTNTYSSGGVLDFASNGLADLVLSDGVAEFELYELLDDLADAIDATYTAGSTLTFDVMMSNISGDFDGNGFYECADVDMLVGDIVAGTNPPDKDLTQDGFVDQADLAAWLAEAGAAQLPSGNPYLPADINLDGFVDGNDFIEWNNNRFQAVPEFCAGDVNADGFVDGNDFIVWNNFRFQSSDGISAVPEPAFGSALLLLTLLTVRRR